MKISRCGTVVRFLGLTILTAVTASAAERSLLVHPQPAAPLAERWAWAKGGGSEDAPDRWLGWSVRRLMGRNQIVGAYFGRSGQRQPLQDRIYGTTPDIQLRSGIEGKVWRQIAIVLRVQGTVEAKNIRQIELVSLDWPADLGDAPLVWLGEATEAESLSLLESLFPGIGGEELREGWIDAVGLHETQRDAAANFAKKILESDSSARVRSSAVDVLASLDPAKAVSILVDVAKKDASKEVRSEAIDALASLRNESSFEALQGLARKGTDLEMREEALQSLSRSATAETLAPLFVEIALEDTYEDLQSSAIHALAELPGSIAREGLEKLSQTHPKTQLREKAIEELVELVSPQEAASILERVALKDPSTELQKSAASELQELEPSVALPSAKKLAAEHPNADVRREALDALASLAPPAEAAAELEKAASRDASREVQREAAERLGELPSAIALPALLRLVREHENPQVRQQSLEVLLETAPAASIAPIFEGLVFEDQNREMQEQALEALAHLPTETGLSALLKVAQSHPNEDLRQQAVESLRESSDPRAKKVVRDSDREEESE